MHPITHILFPYDFSSRSCEVVPFVRAMARKFDARVTVYSVVPPTWELPSEAMRPLIADASLESKQALQAHLDRALTAELAGVASARVADSGDPALRIAAFAETHRADLIMMPTHGLGPLRTFLLGSVTSKVLHDATCPVWTAAHAETQRAPHAPGSVLCAVDESSKTPALLTWIAAFCRQTGASLRVLHVVEPVTDWPSLSSERARQDQVCEAAQGRVADLMRAAGIDAPLRVAVGDITQTVSEHARREGADLVIIGRGSVAEPFGRLRTHAFGIIQQSPCPVISV